MFNIGDKVRVRKDLEEGYKYGIYCSTQMVSMGGDVLTIENKTVGNRFYCKENNFTWTVDLFEPIYWTKPQDIEIPIKKVIFNGFATIIFWDDDSKTIVKKSKDDDKHIKGNAKAEYERRIGFLTAYFQKKSGLSKTQANKYIENIIKGEEK